MKTIKLFSKVTMLIAFVAFANTLMATGNLRVNILPVTAERAEVSISNSNLSNFQISIKNRDGEVVYYKETDGTSNDFRKIFDFSKLDKGEYNLSVTANESTTERSFKVENQGISVGNEKCILEPFFGYKDGVLKLSYLNFSENSLRLNFFNEGELIYSKELGNEFNVNTGFNLAKLEKGAYSVVLSTDSKDFKYTLNVE
jgi:hypothetical protein